MMVPLGAAAVKEWRSVHGFISINQKDSPWLDGLAGSWLGTSQISLVYSSIN
jgi:hypothetical protein